MVTVHASVRDSRGRSIPGLGPSDFRLRDRGYLRPIASVTESVAPLRVAVLLDVSGSMVINMDRARRAVDLIVDSLRDGDEAALFTFDKALRSVVPFTPDLARLADVSQVGAPYGKTSLYDAVAETATLVGQQVDNRHPALLVVTDGEDNDSRRTTDEVLEVTNRIALPVYLLAVGGPLHPPAGAAGASSAEPTTTLTDLAGWTGGGSYEVAAEPDAITAIGRLMAGLRHQYILTFEPGFLRGWHPIEIQMVDNRYRVQARRGYVAGPSRLNR